MHKRRRIERDLAAMKNRDEIIREAYAEGFPKKEIHERSGIARTTIDRILREKTMQITDITSILTAAPSEKWPACALAWRMDAEAHGHTTAIVGKDDTPEKKPLVVSDGKTYVLTRYHDNDDWFITAKPYTLPHNRVPVHQITATTNETGPSWERSIEAWLQAARESGHDAQNTGETVNHLNNAPTILVDGDHYVLTRHYDGHTVVTVDYKAVKTERGWVPA
jgi:hypothetical protein